MNDRNIQYINRIENYAQGNIMLVHFTCSTDVKIMLLRAYSISLYTAFLELQKALCIDLQSFTMMLLCARHMLIRWITLVSGDDNEPYLLSI